MVKIFRWLVVLALCINLKAESYEDTQTLQQEDNLMTNRTILVTGGAGYIGSHVCYYLQQQGWNPVTFDNFSTGHRNSVRFGPLVEGDLLVPDDILQAMVQYQPVAVMHLASFIQVGESVKDPLKYYQNNVTGMVNLLQAMRDQKVNYMIFSSSAAVYGNPVYTPIDENHPCHPINPYGQTKWMIEQILKDCDKAYGLKSVSLRYFNAAGAAPAQGLGEAHEPESHLIPLMIQAAQNNDSTHPLKIFGQDYVTRDGTCLRDYIHILDLADAHLKALDYLQRGGETLSVNLGSGNGTTNLEMVQHIKNLFEVDVPFKYADRREGDPAVLLSTYTKAEEVLGWKPTRTIEQILQDAWQWHQKPKDE